MKKKPGNGIFGQPFWWNIGGCVKKQKRMKRAEGTAIPLPATFKWIKRGERKFPHLPM
jgi:hypothetical protein